MNAEQLRAIAEEAIVKSNCLFDIKDKIEKEAKKGKAYLKTGFKIQYLKELKTHCEKNNLLFKDYGNDGSGSEYTTVYIDWSKQGNDLLH